MFAVKLFSQLSEAADCRRGSISSAAPDPVQDQRPRWLVPEPVRVREW